MQLPNGLEENFQFMLLEVRKQVEETGRFLADPSPALLQRVAGREDYIDSMKGLIEEKAFAALIGKSMAREQANLLRALNTMVSNLERIADFAVNVVNQVQYLNDQRYPNRFEPEALFEEILSGLDLVPQAMSQLELTIALRICQSEFRLDDLYKSAMNQIMQDLRSGQETGDLVTSLFIFRYLERMGDSLLNIGEAFIFALIGERLKIQQYQALSESLAASGISSPLGEVEFSSFWGNRSGCRVGSLRDKMDAERGNRVIFKEGKLSKIVPEKQNIERWHGLMPGLAPRIYGFQETGAQGSLLLEFMDGCTMQECLLWSDDELVKNAFFILTETLSTLWKSTRQDKPGRAGYMRQLFSRLEDVYRVHPRFRGEAVQIGAMQLPSMEERLRWAQEMELDLSSPFTVFTHGDFNLNNIIYDHKEQRLHYIDLHRSADTDYVQDISVFMVSCFRLPAPSGQVRARLHGVARDFLAFARRFAEENGDKTFDARLTLGLIRSFFTSTRFELDEDFAYHMFLRSQYLLDKFCAHGQLPWDQFRLPEQVFGD